MIDYYPLSPVERHCPECDGYGHPRTDVMSVCRSCDGIGRLFLEGGPSFGCRYTLGDCKPGMIVTLGNGDRGRVIRHCKRGSPSTEICLIDPMFEEEDRYSTTYPRETGVASMSASSWLQDSSGGHRAREDHLDPLQKRKAI